MRSPAAFLIVLATTAVACGCSPSPSTDTYAQALPESVRPATAVADLRPTEGNTVRGTVTFTREAGGVRIVADLSGLTPGEHGFHIHEQGDCSAPDASSAGDHFNPGALTHGGPEAAIRHAGDLGNLTADAAGNARYDRVDPNLQLEGEASIIGRAVIVHAGADDLSSQPAGNAGPRTACGVIARVGE